MDYIIEYYTGSKIVPNAFLKNILYYQIFDFYNIDKNVNFQLCEAP